LRTEGDAKFVGYGSMLAEGYLAVIALLTAVVGLGVAGWEQFYGAWGAARWPAVWAEGGSALIVPLGIPLTLGAAFFAVVAKSFAATTLDSAMRFTRIVTAEFASTFRLPAIFQDRTVSLIPGFAVVMILALSRQQMALWPLFAATNQILAALALLAAAVFLAALRRPTLTYMIPFAIMVVTSLTAMGWSLINDYIPKGNWLLAVIATIIVFCSLGVLWIGFKAWGKTTPKAKPGIAD
jgi:carbon starvation protein